MRFPSNHLSHFDRIDLFLKIASWQEALVLPKLGPNSSIKFRFIVFLFVFLYVLRMKMFFMCGFLDFIRFLK